MTKITYIPGEIANAAIDEYGNRKPVTRTQHIFDDAKGKSQAEVNAETEEIVSTHAQQIADLQAMEQIVIDGGDAQIAQGSDFDNPDSAKRAKIPTVGAVLDGISEGVFDLTAKTGDSYASLQDALTAANTTIPANKKKGGMQLSFVQSSDNKYVQYRLMADEWSTNTEDWAIADEGIYVENPEFVYVKTDKEGKILWAIKIDGGIYYGAGCPQQVKDYIEEKIAELSLDEYEDIVAFLNGLEEGDKTLQVLLNEKVDKVEGKSLIDSEYASTKSAIDSPEFFDVTLDAEDKVLEGTKKDGTKVIGGNLNVGGSASINGDTKVNGGNLNVDGSAFISGDTKILGNMEVSGVSYKVIENPKYLEVKTDNEDKVLGARTSSNILKEEVVSAKRLILSNKGLAEFAKAQRNNYTGTSNILALNPKEKVLPVLKGYKFWNIQSGSVHPDYVPLSLLWFSDIHGNARNLARIKEFYDAFKGDIDDVLCTGDFLYMNYADDFSYWAANGGAGFLNVMGNHDVNNTVPGELNIVSPAVCYERFFAPYIQDWGVNYTTNKLYWYKDYPDAFSEENSGGIRLIALDLFHWKETPIINGTDTQGTEYPDGTPFDTGQQETWFINTLEDARANNMAVIVTLHNPYPDINRVECSFMSLDKTEDSGLRSDMLQDVQDFIDGGGKFITWMCGHTHQDWIGTINGYPDQTLLDIGTASFTINYRYDIMVDGTKSMDRFNIFNIEPVKKYIRLFRIGMEYDRHGRHIGSLVYDYKNHQLVSNS